MSDTPAKTAARPTLWERIKKAWHGPEDQTSRNIELRRATARGWHDWVGSNRHNAAAVRAEKKAKAAEDFAKGKREAANNAQAEVDKLIKAGAPEAEITKAKDAAKSADSWAKVAESDARGSRQVATTKLATAKTKAEARKQAGKPAAAGDAMHDEAPKVVEDATKGGGGVAKDAKAVEAEGKELSFVEKHFPGLKEPGAGKQFVRNINPFGEHAADRRVKAGFRAAGTGVGAYMMVDAVARGKKSDGEDRGAAGRVLEFVVGGGVGAASALTGKALGVRA